MVRSRSRSPRWKHRSISPTYGRSQEYLVERPLYQSYSSELREFGQSSGRPVQWRNQREKWTETVNVEPRSGDPQYGAVHHKIFEYGHPSPNARRVETEYTATTGRNCYLQEREGNQTYPLPSRFLEVNPYNDHDERPSDSSEWHDQRHHSHSERHHEHDQWQNDLDDRHHHQNVEIPTHSRLYSEKPKSFGGDPQMDSYEKPVVTTYGSTEKWYDSEDFRSHGLHEERYSGSSRSPGRRAEEFPNRSSYQKRYPEEDEVRGYREASGRNWVPGKHEEIEHERDLKLRGEKFPPIRKSYPPESYGDSEGIHVKDLSKDRYSNSDRYEEYVQHVSKKEVIPRSTTSVTRGRTERGKELRKRSEFSKDRRDDAHKRSSHRSCHVETSRRGTNSERDRKTESLTIKLDMKKSVNKSRPSSSHASERLMSRDLVSVGKKRDEFHHVFEHMGSSFKANPNISSGQFAQEIITLMHQIKEDHFKSPDLTLHDRFSKLQDAQSPEREEEKGLVPEIHRRIDMSLTDLHSWERKPIRKTSTWVAVNPDDLRHDIERRRKERLQDKYKKPRQTVEPRFLSHRSERPEKSRSLNRMKTARNPHFKEPPVGLVERREKLRRETTARKEFELTRKIGDNLEPRHFQRSLKPFVKDYTSSGRKRDLTFETKYRRIYGVGFGRTNHRIFTKHYRQEIVRKRRAEREVPSSTTDK
ncbi:hypothetical protein scyTo_0018367 [Scyliorhinus torazame]|uniref:BCLAF1 and THRAP3 family member 3 n=1 Tax=Scyliorhinus torazame TaxID=75743 RepID=A0A401PUA1_SCYTO|nr:hypothetical protein [Scyliorhinus torazame]